MPEDDREKYTSIDDTEVAMQGNASPPTIQQRQPIIARLAGVHHQDHRISSIRLFRLFPPGSR